MRQAIHLHELAIANFRTTLLTSADLRGWMEASDVALIESCSRQALLGFKKDFSAFPFLGHPSNHFYEGPDAYKFLVRLACGLESARINEDNIKGQLFDGWDAYTTADTAKRKALDSIMQDVKADSRFVHGATLSKFQFYRHELSARDLSGQQKGETILVVGSRNRHGELSGFTEGIISVTGNNRGGRVSEILVTSPNTQDLSVIHDKLRAMKVKGVLAADIVRIPFAQIGRHIERADRVFVDIAMGSSPVAEGEIISVWQGRVRQDNKMVMLRGNPMANNTSTGLWADVPLTSYISPEDIQADMRARGAANSKILEAAKDAVEYCVSLRERGESPSNAKVRNFVGDLGGPAPAAA